MDSPSVLLLSLSLVPFAVVGSFTPGPNNILVMSHGISHGLKATLSYQLGAGAACFVIIGGIVLTGAQLDKVLPVVMEMTRYLGCAYMLWLAWVVARSPAPQVTTDTADAACGPHSTKSAVNWRSGFLLQFINPKFYLYALTLAAVLAPAVRATLEVCLLGLFFSVVAMAGMLCWASAGALLQGFLRRWHRATSVVMALALVWCAVSLF